MEVLVEQHSSTFHPEVLIQDFKNALRSADITSASGLIVQIYKQWSDFDEPSGEEVQRLEAVYLTLVNHHLGRA